MVCLENSSPGLLSGLNPDVDAINQETYQISGEAAQKSAWELARLDTGTGTLVRSAQTEVLKYQTQNEPTIDPIELNKKFPKMPKPFTEPVNMTVAQRIYDNQNQRQDLQDRVNAGPQDGWYGFTNKWGANLLAHATDPLELGAGFAVSAALPALAPAAVASKLGLGVAEATIGQTVAKTFVEGALANAATQPLEYYNSKQEQRDYDAEGALVGALGTAAGFSVLHGAVKIGSNGLNRFLGRVAPKHAESIEMAALSQSIEGKKISVDPVINEMVSDTNYQKPNFVKIPDENIADTTFYSPKEIVTQDPAAKSAVISDDYGQGVYLTDDANVANGAASRKLNPTDGSIISGKVNEASLVDLDNANMDPRFIEAAKTSLEGSDVKIDPEKLGGKDFFSNVHDAIEEGKLPADFLETLKSNAQAQGIDGYRFTADQLADQPHAAHNAMVLFDHEKFSPEGNLLPDKDAVPRISKEEAQAHFVKNDSVESSIHYDPESFPKFENTVSVPPESPKVAELKKTFDSFKEDIQTQIESLGDHPDAKELVKLQKDLEFDAKKVELQSTAIKAAGDCLLRG